MGVLNLKVITMNRIFFEGECLEVIIPSVDGSAGILPGHVKAAFAIEVGEMRIRKTDGSWLNCITGNGHVLVVDDRVTLLADTVETPEEIDAVRAEEARVRAEEQMLQKKQLWEYHMAMSNVARAKARLSIKNKYLQN